MRHAARTDENQPAIVERLREIGIKPILTHRVGDGFPDLVVGHRKRTIFLEVKMPGEGLNKDQAKFLAEWDGGEYHIVRTPEEAVKAVLGRDIFS